MYLLIDEESFREVFNTYYDRIYTGFYRKTGSYEIAQDLTQQTFIKFWRYRDSYTPELTLEIQLFRKGKLVFIDWLRKESKERQLIDSLKQQDRIPVDELSTDLKDSLTQAINGLSPVRKEVFQLAYIEGYSHKEIAEKLNVSVRTVETHIYKSVQQLRKILALIYILLHL
ncbi:sigma-70 family RNA polymerase sigma factor [Sphingobacterium sp. DK4209]|uniref:Sigma-70 family RNA polymerase sigma factor n=1 Tax=Sphingobacterium zhuxiongii TaxID=2662364 RepID=A0A5Q0Q8Y7_9SPHI|nr:MULTISPECIES: RNA polymerase sigma factor [unclassified Sphingobacterium]MVZ66116.1 sigma-70 family RNA polymerase sigma factor [Sphingobacterium sp. DK4209]QGA26537.1 sigma-70 family RNA polymerase sigma factor [Sphingobacterium sp. dk4302]